MFWLRNKKKNSITHSYQKRGAISIVMESFIVSVLWPKTGWNALADRSFKYLAL